MQHVLVHGLVGRRHFAPRIFLGIQQNDDRQGLFGAGDTVGGAHKFSSGSFTEGRLAAKAAVKYIQDKKEKT